MKVIVDSFVDKIITDLNNNLNDRNISIRERKFIKSLGEEFLKVKTENNYNPYLFDAIRAPDKDLGVDWFYDFLDDFGYDEEKSSKSLDNIICDIKQNIELANSKIIDEYEFSEFRNEIEEGKNLNPYFYFYSKFFHVFKEDINSELGKRHVQVLQDNSSNFKKVLGKYIGSQITNVLSMDKINRNNLCWYLDNNKDYQETVEKQYLGNYDKFFTTLLDSTNNGKNRDIINWLTLAKRKVLEDELGGVRKVAEIVGVKFECGFEDRILTNYDFSVKNRDINFYNSKVNIALEDLLKNYNVSYHESDLIVNLEKIRDICGDDLNLNRNLITIVERVLDKFSEGTQDKINYAIKSVLEDIRKREVEILKEIGSEFKPEYIENLKVEISTLDSSNRTSYLTSVIEKSSIVDRQLINAGMELVQNYRTNLFHREFGGRVVKKVNEFETKYLRFKNKLEKIIDVDLF